jgi:hypothetical protein
MIEFWWLYKEGQRDHTHRKGRYNTANVMMFFGYFRHMIFAIIGKFAGHEQSLLLSYFSLLQDFRRQTARFNNTEN